jgi:FkbM family methyltransferase
MIEGIKARLRNSARWAGTLPLRVLGERLRTEAIEELSEGTISETVVPGGKLRFWTPAMLLRYRAKSVLTKEPDTIAWLDSLGKDSVLWDIGANVGVYSLYAACCRRCRVIAFEPSAANFHVLTRNIDLNKASDRITAYCLALSGTTHLGVLNLASASMGTALSQFGQPGDRSRYWSDQAPTASHGMVGFTVDDFIAQFPIAFPTHVKLDVDGLEWPILEGASGMLQDPRLQSVMVELTSTNEAERISAVALLKECGLELASRGEVQETGTEKAANHLFVRGSGPSGLPR